MLQLLRDAQLVDGDAAAEQRLRMQVGLAVEALDDAAVWAAVEAVADTVLRRGPLSGSEIEAIVEPMLKAPSGDA